MTPRRLQGICEGTIVALLPLAFLLLNTKTQCADTLLAGMVIIFAGGASVLAFGIGPRKDWLGKIPKGSGLSSVYATLLTAVLVNLGWGLLPAGVIFPFFVFATLFAFTLFRDRNRRDLTYFAVVSGCGIIAFSLPAASALIPAAVFAGLVCSTLILETGLPDTEEGEQLARSRAGAFPYHFEMILKSILILLPPAWIFGFLLGRPAATEIWSAGGAEARPLNLPILAVMLALLVGALAYYFFGRRSLRQNLDVKQEEKETEFIGIEPIEIAEMRRASWKGARARIINLYFRLVDRLQRIGVFAQKEMTPLEFGEVIRARRQLDATAFLQVVRLFYRARYSNEPIGRELVKEMKAAVAAVERK